MKLWSIIGNSQRLDGGAMFGNVPKAMWSKWLQPDEQNRIPLACRALLAEPINGKTVLFETGIGAFFDPKLRERFGVVEDRHVLLENLAAAGFQPDDIDVVVLSHLHFDHAGGLLQAWQPDAEPELVFNKARFVISRAAWERACDPHPRDRASFIPALIDLLRSSGRLELVDGEHCDSLGDAVRFHYSEGHTPGLLLSEIVGPGNHGGLLFCADLIPGRAWVHLPVTMGYDRYPEKLIDEKRALLIDLMQREVRLFFTHDAECALARVVSADGSRFSTDHEVTELHARALGEH
ncbi:MBL fold metallo-hydrolase [Pseudomarimonas arenosa]|uniref:MBL fold metallo-hydrolase n=1 Tax=Pseudomarimonas arenosa TaxID=2774145 RepID=A0AAW3ZKC8_9GAMM|nr:MBL fold metallo-hydrolase [Pseudomarimonas arenosa]MBD8526578.1 MBL fold metallo-hydrolase [Pseudomarimonas arenosa]